MLLCLIDSLLKYAEADSMRLRIVPLLGESFDLGLNLQYFGVGILPYALHCFTLLPRQSEGFFHVL